MLLETLKYQVQENKEDIKALEQRFDKFVERFENQEDKIDKKIDERFNEIKKMLEGNEMKSSEKNKDLHSKIDSLVENSHQQNTQMLEIKYDMREMNKFMSKIEEKNKWLGRMVGTAAIGFVGTFINAVLQTYVF